MKNYVLIGDIHSQYSKLHSAVEYIRNNIENFHIIFLGDLFDSRTSDSDSVSVYNLVRSLFDSSTTIQSNHQDKLIRYLKGNSVSLTHGLDRTISDFKSSDVCLEELLNWLQSLAYGVSFKDSSGLEYRCAHAYFSSKFYVADAYEDEYLITTVSKKTKSKCIYGIRGMDNSRIQWWLEKSNHDWIRVAGHYHTVHIDLEESKSIVLDGECGNDDGILNIYSVNQKQLITF